MYTLFIYIYIVSPPSPTVTPEPSSSHWPRGQQSSEIQPLSKRWVPRGDADYTWHTWRCSTFCGFSTRHIARVEEGSVFFPTSFLLGSFFGSWRDVFVLNHPRKKNTIFWRPEVVGWEVYRCLAFLILFDSKFKEPFFRFHVGFWQYILNMCLSRKLTPGSPEASWLSFMVVFRECIPCIQTEKMSFQQWSRAPCWLGYIGNDTTQL